MNKQAEFYCLAVSLMSILITAIKVVAAAGIVAMFSYFMDYCLMDGSIFGRWLPWLSRTILKVTNRSMYKVFINAEANRTARDEMFIQQTIKNPLWKILGGCPVCSNVWVSAGLFFVFAAWWHISFTMMPIYIILSSMILRRVFLRGE